MKKRSPTRGFSNQRNQSPSKSGAKVVTKMPFGIDASALSEDEVNKFLKITSDKSLKEIAEQTQKLSGEGSYGKAMVTGDEKITLQEIQSFMQEISNNGPSRVNKKDLMNYLSAFPQPHGQEGRETSEKKAR